MKTQIRFIRGKAYFVPIDTKGEPSVVPVFKGAWRQSTYRGVVGKTGTEPYRPG